MELKALLYFKEVVESGSILKASHNLHISQPPLSRMMKNLEKELNTVLFIRGKQLKLTDSGKILYDKANVILNLSNNINEEINSLNNKNELILNIGAVSSSTSLLYENTLNKFREAKPNIKFNIMESNTFVLLDYLDKRIIDIAITRTPFDKEIYDYILLDREPMVLTSNNNIKDKISFKDLSKYNIIIYRRFEDLIYKLAKKYNINLNIVAKVDDAKTAILLAKSLNVNAIVPYGAYNTFKDNLNSSIIDEDNLYTSLTIVKRKNEELSNIYDELIKYLKNKENLK